VITHFHDHASNPEWIREQIAMETEGEITPAQASEPHEVVMDEQTPALLRKQAA
jgi:hypothetical protein